VVVSSLTRETAAWWCDREDRAMIDTLRASEWPADMREAAGEGHGPIEATARDLVDSLRHFVHERPEAAVCWALGIGFVLGWKLKPW